MAIAQHSTSLTDTETLEELQSIGFKDCILKPFQGPVLLDQIKKYALVPDSNPE